VRNSRDGVNGVDNLWLTREPSIDEIIADINSRNLANYDELVFCGYGEPMIRYDDVLSIAASLKADTSPPRIRINTNGHANLIAERDITPDFSGKIDIVSISLNAKSASEYDEVCKSVYGESAYDGMLDFAKRTAKYTRVILTVVDKMQLSDIEACREIAENLGVEFRVREYF